MPTYEYFCDNCEFHEEFQLLISKRDSLIDSDCPKCKEGKLQRQIGSPRMSYDTQGALKRAGDGFKEVQQKIIESGLGRGHTVRVR